MRTKSPIRPPLRPGLHFILLCTLLCVLFFAGGASRADALGQSIVRGVSWLMMVIIVLFGARSDLTPGRPVLVLLSVTILLPLLQLLPLPPSVWQALPGHAILTGASVSQAAMQPWRPWSMTPGSTINALSSLIVPLVTFLCVMGLRGGERRWLPAVLLGLIAASTVLGLLQFSGAGFDNPFINGSAGQVSGSFANRNHFALFVAFGCLLAPIWVFFEGRRREWRGPIALGLLVVFALTILASGSRAGLMLGLAALVIGLLLVRHEMRSALKQAPRWAFPALVAAMILTIAVGVLVSVAADRAEAINRVFLLDPGQDMRRRGLSTVLEMVRIYFPMGSGLGGFDPMFRMHEPFGLLKPTYFNHAHNDFLEIAMDAGLPGLVVLLAAIGWWLVTSVRVWSRAGDALTMVLARTGSAMLLLVFIASAFDYPARTPMMMAMIVIAAVWLADGTSQKRGPALP